jgi:hypothetical protein
MSLAAALLQPGQRAAVVADCVRVLDQEVADKGGLSGIAVRGAFAVVKAFQPNFIPRVVDGLLDEFLGAIEPFYDQWIEKPAGRTLPDHFVAHGAAIADRLLAITDERARHSKLGKIVKVYEGLRPKAKEHVVAAMRRVGDLVDRHSRPLRTG